MIGVISSIYMVTYAEYYSKAKLLLSGNHKWVTIIKCIHVYSKAVLLYIIFKAKGHT